MLLPGLAQRGGWSRNHRGSRSPVKGLRAASPPTEAFSLSSPYKQVQAILPHTGDLSGRFLTAAFTLPPSCGHDQDWRGARTARGIPPPTWTSTDTHIGRHTPNSQDPVQRWPASCHFCFTVFHWDLKVPVNSYHPSIFTSLYFSLGG